MEFMITTHILDTSCGRPAEGVVVNLYRGSELGPVASGLTNADGRVGEWDQKIEAVKGSYRLEFEVAPYFLKRAEASFYTTIQIAFNVADATEHYHVPLLLNPFGYSTYRGS